MLVLRLKRVGKKNKPTYRVVVAEHSNAVSGSYVADLGHYNPHTKELSIDKEEATNWMNKGAKPSNRVSRLLDKEKVKHKSIVVIKYNKAPKKSVEEKSPSSGPVAEKVETEESPVQSISEPTEVTPEVAVEDSAVDEVKVSEATEKPAEISEESTELAPEAFKLASDPAEITLDEETPAPTA